MALSYNTSLKTVASKYVRLLNIRLTGSTVEKEVEEHPYYPSLLSISETFNRHHISNTAYTVSPEEFPRLPPPFVAFIHLPGIGKDFVLITRIDLDSVTYFHQQTATTLPLQEFLQSYRNVVWVAEPDEKSGDAAFGEKRKLEKKDRQKKITLATVTALLLLTIFLINLPAGYAPAFTLVTSLHLLGAAVTLSLLLYEAGKDNTLVKKVCTAGRQVNCDAVLNSRASRIGEISWAEIGFFYFSASLLWLLFPGTPFTFKIAAIVFSGIGASVYIPFSIWYQWRIVRQWCPLCLVIQFILLAQLGCDLGMTAAYRLTLQSLVALPWPALTACLLLPPVAWYTIRPLLITAKEYGSYAPAYRRLQYNPDIFRSILRQQPKAPEGWKELGIRIGDPLSHITLLKICSPYCSHCATSHKDLEKLVHDKNIQARILFINANTDLDKGSRVVKHFLGIQAMQDVVMLTEALDDWYLSTEKDYDRFAARFPLKESLAQQGEQLEAMHTWCSQAEITHTPTFFVDGYRLPATYDLAELKYIL